MLGGQAPGIWGAGFKVSGEEHSAVCKEVTWASMLMLMVRCALCSQIIEDLIAIPLALPPLCNSWIFMPSP